MKRLRLQDILNYVKEHFNPKGDPFLNGCDPEIVDVFGLTEHSQLVEKGWLFAALPGEKADGRDYINDAIERGARCILTDLEVNGDITSTTQVCIIKVEKPRQFFAWMASAFYHEQPKYVAAVTGTNGKTSTARFTQQIWESCGFPSASLGTLGLSVSQQKTGEKKLDSASLTTPGPAQLHLQLTGIAQTNVQHVVMEASSHGLKQYRLDGVRAQAAAFTNLSHDHLDYHPDMEDYFQAKSRLFSDLLVEGGTAILNMDDEYSLRLIEQCEKQNVKMVTYGKSEKADLRILDIEPKSHGMSCTLSLWGQKHAVNFPLIGEFQLYNALTALGLALSADQNIDRDQAIASLSQLKGVRGRLQSAGSLANGASVYIDFAHTPDALIHVLSSLRPHCQGKLWVVFGCGGDRDQKKRPEMGKVANEYADHIVITDDNPRTENPKEVRKQILAACPEAKEMGDRKKAIWNTIAELQDNDILLIAGKGHEPGQIIGDEVFPFDDVNEARKALQDLKMRQNADS